MDLVPPATVPKVWSRRLPPPIHTPTCVGTQGAAPPPSPTHPLYTAPMVHPPTCDRCSLRASYSWEPLATPSHMA